MDLNYYLGGPTPYPASVEALPPTPRQIRLGFWTNAKRLALLACFLLGPNVALVWGFLAGEELRLLRDSGVETTGMVEYKHAVRGSKSGYTFYVSYQFFAAGTRQFKQVTVTRQEYDHLVEGGDVLVTYLPSNPHVNCLGTPAALLSRRDDTTLWVGGAVALISAVLLAFLEYAVRREIRLATHGLGTVGRIIDSGSQVMRNGTRYWVRYEFTSPTKERAGSWDYVPFGIWQRLPHGQLVTVLYDPRNPSNHLPLYAFKYVNVDARPVAPQAEVEPQPLHSTEAAAIVRGRSTDIAAHRVGASSYGFSAPEIRDL